MSASGSDQGAGPPTSLVIAAFAAVYLMWGSTYLAIRFAIETLPPLVMGGVRFFVAGVILYVAARWFTGIRPTTRHWRDAAIVGCFLVVGGNGGVTLAERTVPSSVAALVVAITPLWMVLADWMRGGQRPGMISWLGLVLGLCGVVFIVAPTEAQPLQHGDVLGIVCLLGASVSWAYGSIWSRTASRPASPFLTVGMQMAAGGLALALVGVLRGELASFDVSAISTRSALAWLHLLVAGALIGFTAYVWLLQVSTPARVSTYAYVNPVIAVLLGVWLGKEPLAANTLTGAVLVVLSVIIILRAPARSRAQKALATPTITSPTSVQPTLGK